MGPNDAENDQEHRKTVESAKKRTDADRKTVNLPGQTEKYETSRYDLFIIRSQTMFCSDRIKMRIVRRAST